MIVKPQIELKYQLAGHNYPIISITYNPKKNHILTSDGHTLRLWSLRTEIKRVILPRNCNLQCLQYSIQEDSYFGVSGALEVRIYNSDLAVINEFGAHQRPILCTAFHEGRQELVSAGVDGVLKVWTCGKKKMWIQGRLLTQLKCQVRFAVQYDTRWITSLFLDERTDRIFASCEVDVLIWHLVTGELLYKLSNLHQLSISSLFFCEGNKYLITSSSDRTVKIWDFQNGRITLLDTLQGHTRKVNHVLYDAETCSLFTCSDDGSIRLWNVEKGEELDVCQVSPSAPAPVPVGSHGLNGQLSGRQAKHMKRAAGGGGAPPDKALAASTVTAAFGRVPALPICMLLGSDESKQSRSQLVVATGPMVSVLDITDYLIFFAQCSDTIVSVQCAKIVQGVMNSAAASAARNFVTLDNKKRQPESECRFHNGLIVLAQDNTMQIMDSRWGHVHTIITPSGKKEAKNLRKMTQRTASATPEAAALDDRHGKGATYVTVGSRGSSEILTCFYDEIGDLLVLGWTNGNVDLLDFRTGSPTITLDEREVTAPITALCLVHNSQTVDLETLADALGTAQLNTLLKSHRHLNLHLSDPSSVPHAPRPDFLTTDVASSAPFVVPNMPASRPSADPDDLACSDALPSTSCSGCVTIASGGADGVITVWLRYGGSGLGEWVRLKSWRAHNFGVLHVGPRPDSDDLVTASIDGTVKVWDSRSFAMLSQVFVQGLTALALLNEHVVICGCNDGSIEIWNYSYEGHPRPYLPTSPMAVMKIHNSRITSLATHADLPYVFVSASDDCSIAVWDTESREQLRSFLFGKAVRSATFVNGEGDILVAVDNQLFIVRYSRYITTPATASRCADRSSGTSPRRAGSDPVVELSQEGQDEVSQEQDNSAIVHHGRQRVPPLTAPASLSVRMNLRAHFGGDAQSCPPASDDNPSFSDAMATGRESERASRLGSSWSFRQASFSALSNGHSFTGNSVSLRMSSRRFNPRMSLRRNRPGLKAALLLENEHGEESQRSSVKSTTVTMRTARRLRNDSFPSRTEPHHLAPDQAIKFQSSVSELADALRAPAAQEHSARSGDASGEEKDRPGSIGESDAARESGALVASAAAQSATPPCEARPVAADAQGSQAGSRPRSASATQGVLSRSQSRGLLSSTPHGPQPPHAARASIDLQSAATNAAHATILSHLRRIADAAVLSPLPYGMPLASPVHAADPDIATPLSPLLPHSSSLPPHDRPLDMSSGPSLLPHIHSPPGLPSSSALRAAPTATTHLELDRIASNLPPKVSASFRRLKAPPAMKPPRRFSLPPEEHNQAIVDRYIEEAALLDTTHAASAATAGPSPKAPGRRRSRLGAGVNTPLPPHNCKPVEWSCPELVVGPPPVRERRDEMVDTYQDILYPVLFDPSVQRHYQSA